MDSHLLKKILAFELDAAGAQLPFTARLAREQGWTHAFAGRVVEEYKRFVALAMLAGHTVTPSEEIDQAWHLHMVYTKSYWHDLCRDTLGKELHHSPTTGGGDQSVKFHHLYEKTLQSYRELFHTEPPDDIWPSGADRFANAAAPRSRKFSVPGASGTDLTDPYEIAFLAGGAPRCSQVAVVKLIKSGAAEWKRSRILKQSSLVASGRAPADLNEIERAVHSSILAYGQKGMPLPNVSQIVAQNLSGVESRLAKLGLRPTSAESGKETFSIMLPMLFLVGVGIVKVVTGISRDKPVVFLCLMILATFVIGAILAGSVRKTTPAGRKVLTRMRDSGGGATDPADPLTTTLCGIGLLGITGLAHDPSIAGLDSVLKNEISQIGNPSSTGCSADGDSGCSSGCGGGCGGCGGD
eukprot:g3550.t1